jgi:hypothetical protein
MSVRGLCCDSVNQTELGIMRSTENELVIETVQRRVHEHRPYIHNRALNLSTQSVDRQSTHLHVVDMQVNGDHDECEITSIIPDY